ncbi:MAG: hypothetical protein JW940_26325 [Polyangiaceae bacterium]|nr:hypothetical protein [Polyangiaceae bacterium]
MARQEFCPEGAVSFDLGRGRVELDAAVARVLVPVDALLELCGAAGSEALRDFGRRLGSEAGRRVAARLSDGLEDVGVETVVEHLGGDLALVGLGSMGTERWGSALVVTFSESPLGHAGRAILAAVVEGALQRAFSRDVTAIALDEEGDSVRLLIVHPKTEPMVRAWLNAGVSWGDLLARLHELAASGGVQ